LRGGAVGARYRTIVAIQIGVPTLKRPEVIAGVLALAVDAAYIALIANRTEGFDGRAVFVALHLAVVGGLFLLSLMLGGAAKAGVLMAGTTSLFLIGFLGLFSIGLPLLAGAFIAMPATARALQDATGARGRSIAFLGAAIAVAVIVLGIAATS
jgi:hypothetical protein